MKTYDIFLVHAWRFHGDWVEFSKLLDGDTSVNWRNFSLPWHDPAISPTNKSGSIFIRDLLESQIRTVQAIILLDGVYSIKSAREWVDFEIKLAILHRKPIIFVPAFDGASLSADSIVARQAANFSVEWNLSEVRAIFEGLLPQ